MENIENNVVQPNLDTAAVPENNQGSANDVDNGTQNPDNYDFRINENGDIEISDDFFGLGEDQQPNNDSVANNSNSSDVNPNEPSVNYYTEEEVANISLDNLDPNRIPPQLVPFYKSMQADYTRKTQAIAQERKDLEARLSSMNNPQPPTVPLNANTMNPQNAPQGNVQQTESATSESNYYKQLQEVAIKNVEKRLGAEFNELDPLHLTALSSEVAQIQNKIADTSRRKQELDSVVSQYTSDPRWNEMQTYVDNVLNSMPYNESKQIRDRIESGDINYISGFLKTARECFYETDGGRKVPIPPATQTAAQVQKPRVTPPVLENAGVGTNAAPVSSSVDLGKLGSMTNEELADLFVQKGLTNE